jgi:RNase H-fold protein (predicted Holliday junction resolvase)
MKVFVLVDYDHETYGVYSSEEKAWSAAAENLKSEGVYDADDIDHLLEEWNLEEFVVEGVI